MMYRANKNTWMTAELFEELPQTSHPIYNVWIMVSLKISRCFTTEIVTRLLYCSDENRELRVSVLDTMNIVYKLWKMSHSK